MQLQLRCLLQRRMAHHSGDEEVQLRDEFAQQYVQRAHQEGDKADLRAQQGVGPGRGGPLQVHIVQRTS